MKKLQLALMASALMLCMSCSKNCQNDCSDECAKESKKVTIEPGEQAPLADVGQKNFGGFQNMDTTGMAARRKAMMEAMNKIRTLSFD